eukprot:502609_1
MATHDLIKMYWIIFYSYAFIIITNASPFTSDTSTPHFQPYKQYTFYYESYEYPLHSIDGENKLSTSISIDNISVVILKSDSRPYLIQLTSTQNTSQNISFFYDDDAAFNTVELWNTPHRRRRRLRSCRRRHCNMWGKCHYHHHWCPPIPPPNGNIYWLARYATHGRFIAYYPGRARMHHYNWKGCAWHCSNWFGGLASIHSHQEQKDAAAACNKILIEPKPNPWSEYGRDRGWRSHSCFIGLHHPFKQWNDQLPVKYTNWLPGQPNNEGNCVELISNLPGWHGRWNDPDCRHKRPCLCQRVRGIVHGHYVGVQSLWPYHHASSYCKHHYGTELATITNEEDQKMAHQLCKKICLTNIIYCVCWIGLQRPFHEWDDGSNADEKFTNWQPGQPNNHGRAQGCTELEITRGYSGRWNDERCTDRRYFLCNLQTPVQRMNFYDREEMISKRIKRHKVQWQMHQMEARRKKIRKAFFEQLRQKQAAMRKYRRQQQQRMREYYRQHAFNKMMGGHGGFGARSTFYGDLYVKKRRLRQWIEDTSDGMKRVNELRLQEKKHKRQGVESRQMMRAMQREDVDELFYRMAHTGEEEDNVVEPDPGTRRCVFVTTDALYELCLNDASILISKYIQKMEKHEDLYDVCLNDASILISKSMQKVAKHEVFVDEDTYDRLSPNANEYDTMQFGELERFPYKEAMDYDDNETRDIAMQIHKVNDVQFLKVIEFIFDHEKNHKRQCHMDEEYEYEMC